MGVIWVWDLHPLAMDALPPMPIETDSPPGATIEVAGKRRVGDRLRLSTGERVPHFKTVSRKGYIPTESDRKTLQGLGYNPDSPAWATIGADLIQSGCPRDDLAATFAPTLVRLLTKAIADGKPRSCIPERPEDMRERYKVAYEQYDHACKVSAKTDISDKAAYKTLESANRLARAQNKPEPFTLHRFSTWSRYLREWRRITGNAKNTTRNTRITEAQAGHHMSVITAKQAPELWKPSRSDLRDRADPKTDNPRIHAVTFY